MAYDPVDDLVRLEFAIFREAHPKAMRLGRVMFFLGIATITGCGGGPYFPFTVPPAPTEPTSLLFAIAPPATLSISATIPLSAAVSNNPASAVIKWSVSCGSAGACGSFSATQTASGAVTNYTAPSAIPSGTTVTITATLVNNSTQTVSSSITITPPKAIVVSFFGVPPASLQVGATVAVAAEIVNDVSANPQVTWTVTCASTACGSFNPTTTLNEQQTNYTAPAAIPTGNTVTITATSVTDPTKSVAAIVTITAAAATLANGTYVFHLSGPVGAGANSVSGAIVAQNGTITGGEQDLVSYTINQNAGVSSYFSDQIVGGAYSTTPDGNLQITINTQDLNIGNQGTETLRGTIVSGSRVLITEVNGAIGTGTLDLQTSTAGPSGGYAFTTGGVDVNGQPAGVGGVLNIDGAGSMPGSGTMSGAGSVIDVNDNFAFTGAQALGASTVSAPDSFGRVVFELNPGTGATFHSLYFAAYLVDGVHIRLVETSRDNFQGVLGGTALSQGANTGTFTSSTVAGDSFVFGTAGEDSYGPLQIGGVLTANTGGTVTGTLNWNDLTGSGTQSPTAFTGAYTVDPTGRATFSSLSDAGATFNYQFEFYLTGNGQGLVLSSATAQVVAGRAAQQTTTTFSASSFSGTFAMSADQLATASGALGPESAIGPITSTPGSSSDALAGFADFGSGATDFAVSGSFSAASNGIFTGTVSGLNPASYTTANDYALYLVDSSEAILIETDNAQLTLGYLELQ
jgi:hypothetical protein